MLLTKCACGAKYQVPDHLAGRRLKCKKCGEPIAVPPPPSKTQSDSTTSRRAEASRKSTPSAARPQDRSGESDILFRIKAEEPTTKPAPVPTAPPVNESARPDWVPKLIDETQKGSALERLSAAGGVKGYLADCVRAALFFLEARNLVAFFMMAVCAAIEPIVRLGGIYGLLGSLVLSGWICSFLFNIVENAAAGDLDLPSTTFTNGVVDDIIAPLFKFSAGTLICYVPLIAYGVYMHQTTPGPGAKPGLEFLVLIGVAAFLWPIVALLIALGGFSSLVRVDLVAKTLSRTFFPYLITVILTAGAVAAARLVGQSGLPIGAGDEAAGVARNLAFAMLMEVVELYAWIVAMSAIGLYYHHFKSRFAWSWE